MTKAGNQARYSRASIFFHWVTLALLVAVYACIELRELFPKGSETRDAFKTWHFMLGLSVFALVWLRLLARWLGGTPPIEPPPPRWQQRVGRTAHVLLYLLMIGMPLAGWMILSAAGKPIPFFGLELPALLAPDKPLAHDIEEVHKTVGAAGYWLIGLHAAAGLYHHYGRRDDTLRRMLPGARG